MQAASCIFYDLLIIQMLLSTGQEPTCTCSMTNHKFCWNKQKYIYWRLLVFFLPCTLGKSTSMARSILARPTASLNFANLAQKGSTFAMISCKQKENQSCWFMHLSIYGSRVKDTYLDINNFVPNDWLQEHAEEARKPILNFLVIDSFTGRYSVWDVQENELCGQLHSSCQAIDHFYWIHGDVDLRQHWEITATRRKKAIAKNDFEAMTQYHMLTWRFRSMACLQASQLPSADCSSPNLEAVKRKTFMRQVVVESKSGNEIWKQSL